MKSIINSYSHDILVWLLCVGLCVLPMVVVAQSQSCPDCGDKGITTNPAIESQCNENPGTPERTNPFVPADKTDKRNYVQGRTPEIIFDWTKDVSRQWYFGQNDVRTIKLPYYQTNNIAVEALVISQDMRPEDGWELLKFNFGYEDNGSVAENCIHPHIILYNRYTAIMRVFLAVGEVNATFNGIEIKVEQRPRNDLPRNSDWMQTSVISSMQKPLRALDDYEIDPMINAAMPFLNDKMKWFYADFVTVYDPCTCLYNSALRIEAKLITVSDIKLQGTSTTINDVKINEQTGKHVGPIGTDEEKQSFTQKATKLVSEVTKSYSKGGSFADDAKKTVEKVITATEKKDKTLKAIGKLASGLAKSGLFAAGLKFAPFAFSAVAVYNFFAGGGKKTVMENGYSAGSLTRSSYEGRMTTSAAHANITMWTPGSKNENLNNDNYPYYNHTLGTFNLVNTPTLYHSFDDINDYDFAECIIPNNLNSFHLDGVDKYRYKLKDPIKYVINPAAGLKVDSPEDIDVWACLQFEFPKQPTRGFNRRNPRMMYEETDNVYRTRYVPIGCLNEVIAEFYINRAYVARWYRILVTPPLSPPYYREEIDLAVNDPLTEPIVKPQCYVKIIANMKRKDMAQYPDAQNALHVGRYPVKIEDKADLEQQTSSWLGDFPLTASLYGHISSSQRAWDKVFIGPGATFDQGADIVISAGEDIEVSPEVTIPSNVQLRIGLPIDCNTVLMPEDEQAIRQNFCTTATYKQQRFASKQAEQDVEVEEPTTGASYTELYDASPNPFGNYTLLRYSIGQPGKVELFVTDALGQRIATLVDSQQGRGTFDVSFVGNDIPAGVYYYTLRTDTFIQTKKVVLMR